MTTHPDIAPAGMKALAIDLFCGLGGWTEGLLANGYYVVGFDIERHEYGDAKYPAQLVLQDILTLHGSQFKDAALIVASPPCQEFSYMAMPWSLAKEKERKLLCGEDNPKRLTALFDACFRIQREACEAAGHHIPMIVENVRGAQKWVGRSRWNFGSFHLWGDVPALMPMTARALKGGWLSQANGAPMRRDDSVKGDGCGWFGDYPDRKTQSLSWTSSKSKARKAASAQIAKIPFVLSSYIAEVFHPSRMTDNYPAPLAAGRGK